MTGVQTCALPIWTDPRSTIVTALGFGLAGWLIGGALVDLAQRAGLGKRDAGAVWQRFKGLPRAAFATMLAHVGLGITVIGITGMSAWQTELITSMHEGESRELAGYEVTLASVDRVQGANYVADRGTFVVERDGREVASLASERRQYVVERQSTTEAGIDITLWRDVYVILGEPTPDGRWTARLYHNPLVLWIWGGTVFMAVGAAVSLSDRRYRIGAPQPSRAKSPTPAAAPAVGS